MQTAAHAVARRRRVARSTPLVAALAVLAAGAGSYVGPTGSSPAAAAAPTDDERPNIVVVLADDLGYNDLSGDRFGPGSSVAETPAIERLAAEGLVATNAYSAPTCSPTRMALLSGLAAPRPDNNTYQVVSLRTERGGAAQGRRDGAIYLTDATRTVGETARDAGYATGYVGKFDVTRRSSQIATAHGFDANLGGRRGHPGQYHARHGDFHWSVGPGLDRYAAPYTQSYVDTQVKPFSTGVPDDAVDALVGTEKHVTDAVGDAALDLVGVGDRPTFTMVGQYAVHSPVEVEQARADLAAKYLDKEVAAPGYAALLEGMDQTVARLIHHLTTTPDPRRPDEVLADNTVVLVTSDNGGRTDTGADNAPWSGGKGLLTEGGVRVPFVAWSGDPSLVRPGVTSSIIENVDLHPTVAEYAGAEEPTAPADGLGLDGESLVGTLAGTSVLPRREHVVHLPGYLEKPGRDQRPETTLRWRDRKLTYSYETGAFRLVDLATDPAERTDLSTECPACVADLGQRMAAWLKRMRPRLARLVEGAEDRLVRLVPGTIVYRDRTATTVRKKQWMVVSAGQEMPFVLRPDGVSRPAPH